MKKMLKIIGVVLVSIVVLIAAAVVFLIVKNKIDSGKAWLADDYYMAFQSDSALEKKYAGIGTYDVSNTVIKSGDNVIKNIRIWYPAELENKTGQYPMIIVVNGSNTAALNYEAFFKRLASWGFIVVGNDDRQTGTGLSASATLEYMLSLGNDKSSIFYEKISQENIGIVGYSQGGAGAVRAVTEYENSSQFKTIFTGSAAYPLLAKNMGWEYDVSKITIPYFMTAGTASSDDTGKYSENDFAGVAPLFSLIDNYNEIGGSVFKLRARASGAEHGEMQMRTDGYMTAWMLYHLQKDEEAGKAFIGENAEILSNVNWQDIEKND